MNWKADASNDKSAIDGSGWSGVNIQIFITGLYVLTKVNQISQSKQTGAGYYTCQVIISSALFPPPSRLVLLLSNVRLYLEDGTAALTIG